MKLKELLNAYWPQCKSIEVRDTVAVDSSLYNISDLTHYYFIYYLIFFYVYFSSTLIDCIEKVNKIIM